MICRRQSSIPFDDRDPLLFRDAKNWGELSITRSDWLQEQQSRLTPAEMEIHDALKTQVDVRFENRPLSEVMETLGRMAGVNVYLDPQGLHAEGRHDRRAGHDQPRRSRSRLRSALNLILEPLRLSYVIQNEVLRITSEQTRDSNVYTRVYNVADLVIPIPELHARLQHRACRVHSRSSQRAGLWPTDDEPAQSVPLTLASADTHGRTDATLRCWLRWVPPGMLPQCRRRGHANPMGFGPGGMGGADHGRLRHADRADHHAPSHPTPGMTSAARARSSRSRRT